jgi:hypothetical protein
MSKTYPDRFRLPFSEGMAGRDVTGLHSFCALKIKTNCTLILRRGRLKHQLPCPAWRYAAHSCRRIAFTCQSPGQFITVARAYFG